MSATPTGPTPVKPLTAWAVVSDTGRIWIDGGGAAIFDSQRQARCNADREVGERVVRVQITEVPR